MKKLAIILVFALSSGWGLAYGKESSKYNINRQQACLAKTIYHESRGESPAHGVQTAMLVIRRTHSPNFPSTICKVVAQPGQFQWVGRKMTVRERDAWVQSMALASLSLRYSRSINDLTNGALYFHRTRPTWMRGKVAHSVRLGKHEYVALKSQYNQ